MNVPQQVIRVINQAAAFAKKAKGNVRYADYEFFKYLLHANGYYEYDKLVADAMGL